MLEVTENMKNEDCKDDDTDVGHRVERETNALDEMVTDVGKMQQKEIYSKFVKLARNANYVTTLKENSVSVRIPVPTGPDLTRTGNIGIWNIIRWCEGVENIGDYTRNPATDRTVLDMDKIYANRFVFLVSVKCTVGEDLYKLVDASEPTPISIDYGLHNIGNSSWGTVDTILDESGRVLAQVSRQSVLVDDTSRKPTPIPDWWKKKYGTLVRENKKLVLSELCVPAENTYKHSFKVSWNDIDEYQHVNYVSYVMFCFDAAMDAVKNRFYIGFFDDILKYNVKTLRIRYMNEALAGDILTVVTWQDAQNPRIIHFSIEREGQVLVQCSMEFFLRANL